MKPLSFFPPVFDKLGQNALTEVEVESPAELMSCYWHGTTENHVESILKNGLQLSKAYQHVCLSTKAHVAHFWARNNQMDMKPGETPSVLIRIPSAVLDPDRICIETGYVELGPYGMETKKRANFFNDKNMTNDMWKEFQKKYDVIGYKDPIPVDEAWLDFRAKDIDLANPHNIEDDHLLNELDVGTPAVWLNINADQKAA